MITVCTCGVIGIKAQHRSTCPMFSRLSAIFTKCRCGAHSLLSVTVTGVRYEENAGAICRHRMEACEWFDPRCLAAPAPAQDKENDR